MKLNDIRRPTLQDAQSLALIAFVSFMLSASCSIGDILGGSGGRSVRMEPSTPGPDYNSFTFHYDNELYFTQTMVGTVDNVFARIAAGDNDALKLAREFIRPGFDVLNDHGIALKIPTPVAASSARQLTFDTDWSLWTTPELQQAGLPLCTAITLDHVSERDCQWKARLMNAYAEFNPLTPKTLSIHAALEVRIQSMRGGSWSYPRIDRHAEDQLRKSLQDTLVRRYYAYLKDKGVDVTSPMFRGFNELKH